MAEVRGDLLDRVVQTINRYSMLDRRDRVGVAVSGGADSVFLLHALAALAPDRELSLAVLHVNHHLRGDESDGDERFARDLAARLALPFHSMSGPVREGNLEQEARDIRRHLLEGARRELRLARIALGHTRTDQAETVLFRLLRGSGICGLAAIPPRNQSTVRPLLDLSRMEIRDYLSEAGLPWREDSTNRNQRFVRNRLRLRTLPVLQRTYNPNLEEALAGTAELSRAEEEYWAEQMESLCRQMATQTAWGIEVDVKTLANQHLAVRRRVIRHLISRVKGSLRSVDRQHIEAVLAIVESRHGHDRVNIPAVDVIRSFDQLLLTDPEVMRRERHYSVQVEFGSPCQIPFGTGELRLTIAEKTSRICATVEDGSGCNGEEAFLDSDAICPAASTGDLTVRNWQPGDQLQLVGQGSAVKVKSLFQEHKIALWRRKHWPVLVASKEIVWVRGFGVAQRFAAGSGSTDRVRLCFEAGN